MFTAFAQNVNLCSLLCTQIEFFGFSEIYLLATWNVVKIYITNFCFVNVHTILTEEFEMLGTKPAPVQLSLPKILGSLVIDRTRLSLCLVEN